MSSEQSEQSEQDRDGYYRIQPPERSRAQAAIFTPRRPGLPEIHTAVQRATWPLEFRRLKSVALEEFVIPSAWSISL